MEQYYPTPRELAEEMLDLFDVRPGADSVVLDPSAGEGHLLRPLRYSRAKLLAVEINQERAEALRERGIEVMQDDFMRIGEMPHVTHIVMNPPFRNGIRHVLHAWLCLWGGEIVALLSKDSLERDTEEADFLRKLIDLHGTVHDMGQPFKNALRPCDVEVVAVHLVKKPQQWFELGDGQVDNTEVNFKPNDDSALILAPDVITARVAHFDRAVALLKKACFVMAQADAAIAAAGKNLDEYTEEKQNGSYQSASRDFIYQSARKIFNEKYADLKERAWLSVFDYLRTRFEMTERAMNALVSTYTKHFKPLAFSEDNINNLIDAVVRNTQVMMEDAVLGLFDTITRYSIKNVGLYAGYGWKSNSRHQIGMKIIPKRFILPLKDPRYHFEGRDVLRDIDLAMRYVDGKRPESGYSGSLVGAFDNDDCFMRLKQGERLQCEYFDIRYYQKRGSVHFFPRRADLIERINKIVGKRRGWIPDLSEVSDAWAKQYQAADNPARTEAIIKTVAEQVNMSTDDVEWSLISKGNVREEAFAAVARYLAGELEALGHNESSQGRLIA